MIRECFRTRLLNRRHWSDLSDNDQQDANGLGKAVSHGGGHRIVHVGRDFEMREIKDN
jgi:hypothetical protein